MDDEDDGFGEQSTTKDFTLAKNSELRVECSNNSKRSVHVTLEEGSAEVFGAELQKGNKLCITGHKLAVFTWTGCRLTVEGAPTLVYQAESTPMGSYLNLHAGLTTRRAAALAASTAAAEQAARSVISSAPVQAPGSSTGSVFPGPRVILVGPTDSGKSTVCRLLLNWGVRSGWEPTFVDLDVGQGNITVPGCVAACPVESPLEVEPEGGSGSSLDLPLVHFFGHTSPGDAPELYKYLLDRMALTLERRNASNPQAAASGLVINTLGWVDGLGYELQLHAIQAFQADVVVVLEQDRLYSQLSQEFKGRPSVQVYKLDKSGGCVKRERDERRLARDRRVREYFYGSPYGSLQPVTNTVRADQLLVFRVGGGPKAPSSALPIGAVASAGDPLKVTHVPATSELMQSVLAVSHATSPDQLLSANVAGFILIKEVDVARGTVTYLAPCPGPLPGRYLLAGSLRSALD
ncbi:Pre-mRNA cleavage complex II protein Clp1-domain-containing protein [Haematococcus lacustris]